MCCLVKSSDPNGGWCGKRQETQVVWSFRFSVRSDAGLLYRGALLLVHVTALLVRVLAYLCGDVALPGGDVLLLVRVTARLSGGIALPGAVFAMS